MCGSRFAITSRISIHAPARGAMFSERVKELEVEFQSTHLHEVRYDTQVRKTGLTYFNPRTCTRCDGCRGSVSSSEAYFNPRTCTRCDLRHRRKVPSSRYFNPRTCTRCDFPRHVGGLRDHISIHAPARGAMYVTQDKRLHVAFQSTHLHEVRYGRGET